MTISPNNYHYPVLLDETVNGLDVKQDWIYLDCTLGHGGHALEILKRGGIVYGFDLDTDSLEIANSRITSQGFKDRFVPINSNFVDYDIIASKINKPIGGVLFDLGLNSAQYHDSNQGFSFQDNLLDMRLDKTQHLTAEEIVNTYSEQQLYHLFSSHSQETLATPISQRIIRHRQRHPIKDSITLTKIVDEVYREFHRHTKITPATKVFMALRIEVNHELENLKTILNKSLNSIFSNTIFSIISFHSGEDRIIKHFIDDKSKQGLIEKISKNPIKPKFEETKRNPPSRSATLRSYKIN